MSLGTKRSGPGQEEGETPVTEPLDAVPGSQSQKGHEVLKRPSNGAMEALGAAAMSTANPERTGESTVRLPTAGDTIVGQPAGVSFRNVKVSEMESAFDDAMAGILTSQQDSERTPTGADRSPVEQKRDDDEVGETFKQLAVLHMSQVRDLMMELHERDAPKSWIALCEPAVDSLQQMSDQMALPELKEALGEFSEALSGAQLARSETLGDDSKQQLLTVYEKLVRVLPDAFEADSERDRREPIIVDSLLRQVPEVHRVTIDRLYAAGLTTFESFLRAEPSEIVALTGISKDVAERIVERFQDDHSVRSARLSAPAPAQEYGRLASLITELRGHHTALQNARSLAEKKGLRRARENAFLEVTVGLARLGEIELLAWLERLPFAAKIDDLERYLAQASADATRRFVVPGSYRPAKPSPDAEYTREQLLQRVSLGKRVERSDLCGLDLSGAALVGTSFRRSDLDGANLERADLRKASFKGASLREAYLAHCDLRGADLQNADLEGAILSNADLTGANLTRANLEGANLQGARLARARFAQSDLQLSNLGRADLTEAVFQHADLECAYLGGVSGRGADLTGANLRSSNLEEAELTQGRLDDACLASVAAAGARFIRASLVRVSFSGGTLVDADLTEADLRNANLTGATLTGARLTAARVAGLLGTGAPLEGVELEWLDGSVEGGDFERLGGPEAVARISGIAPIVPRIQPPQPDVRRPFGRGDVLRDATLGFDARLPVEIEGLLQNCTVELGEGARLTIGPGGTLVDCRVIGGGSITVQGKFFEGQSPGIVRPRALVVRAGGCVDSAVEQADTHTKFGFESGCNLRLRILQVEPTHREGGKS